MKAQDLKKVLIVYTGGTFGMEVTGARVGLPAQALKPKELARRLKERVPELEKIAHCDVEIVVNRDSAHIGAPEWEHFADLIRSKWRAYDGVVLLHGTDTMAYTASALSFLLRPCLKPVVLTGAQRPLSALRTDARRNLISAVEIAAQGPREQVAQVSVFFDNRLFQGNRVRKRSASEFEAFESPQAPPLAVVGTKISYAPGPAKKRSKAPALEPVFNDHVAILHVTPGFPARTIRECLLPSVDGLVLVVFPSGTAPTHEPDFIELLQAAHKGGLPVVIVTEGQGDGMTQDSSGAHPSTYAAGRQLLSEGGYWAGTMTPECAFVKTAWILGQKDGSKRFSALWKKDFAGEGG